MQTSLFVRGDESILVVRFPAGLTVNTFGPGRVQNRYDFEDEIALDHFWQLFEETLAAEGWVLHPVPERRRYVTERTWDPAAPRNLPS